MKRNLVLEYRIRKLETRVAMLEKRCTSYGLTDVTWDDYLDKGVVTKVRDIVNSKISDDADVSEVFNFHSYNDGNNKSIRLYTFEIENKAEEWDDVEEYGETWDDLGGAEAYAEDKDAKQYTLLNDHGKICVVVDRLMGSGPSNELGTYSSVEDAANAIVKSRMV